MKKGKYRKKKGFTIIEVSLVLAIAGLILVMVFIALPALQRQQRDAQRKEDVLSFITAVKKYQTNNRGALPVKKENETVRTGGNTNWDNLPFEIKSDSWFAFYKNYLGNSFSDPSGTNYILLIKNCGNENNCGDTMDAVNFPNNYTIHVYVQAECDGSKPTKSSNPRKVAALYKLESAGVYCANT